VIISVIITDQTVFLINGRFRAPVRYVFRTRIRRFSGITFARFADKKLFFFRRYLYVLKIPACFSVKYQRTAAMEYTFFNIRDIPESRSQSYEFKYRAGSVLAHCDTVDHCAVCKFFFPGQIIFHIFGVECGLTDGSQNFAGLIIHYYHGSSVIIHHIVYIIVKLRVDGQADVGSFAPLSVHRLIDPFIKILIESEKILCVKGFRPEHLPVIIPDHMGGRAPGGSVFDIYPVSFLIFRSER
jgi:hypothetical protein